MGSPSSAERYTPIAEKLGADGVGVHESRYDGRSSIGANQVGVSWWEEREGGIRPSTSYSWLACPGISPEGQRGAK